MSNEHSIRKTKIVCTIGPRSESKEVMRKLIDAGMNVMRLNFSHGNQHEHGARIKLCKEIANETGKHLAIMLDTKGPEVRTLALNEGREVQLTKGQQFTLTTDHKVIGDNCRVAVSYKYLAQDIALGSLILIDDGLLALKVIEIYNQEIICRVENQAVLGEYKGINLPNIHVNLPALSEQDKQDLQFGCQQQVDFIAASFVRNKCDVLEIRDYLDCHNGAGINVIAKIENQEGIDNFEQILDVADGVMVARGDLGVEIPVEEVILVQKMIIKKCNAACKPVIIATQMLDSMIKNPRPTRAEAGDVANAIFDGADAVMLSGETAKGNYPIEATKTMASICLRTDNSFTSERTNNQYIEKKKLRITESVCFGAVEAARQLRSPLIIAATRGGKTARSLRKYCPAANVLAVTADKTAAHQLSLVKGIQTQLIAPISSTDSFYRLAKKIGISSGLAQVDDIVIMVSGALVPAGITNTVSVHVLE